MDDHYWGQEALDIFPEVVDPNILALNIRFQYDLDTSFKLKIMQM